MNTLFKRLASAMCLALFAFGAEGCVAATDSDADETDDTTAEAVSVNSLNGCHLETGEPKRVNLSTGDFMQAKIHVWCPTPRKSRIRAEMKKDIHFWNDDVLETGASKIRTMLDHWYTFRAPCNSDGKDGAKYFVRAVAESGSDVKNGQGGFPEGPVTYPYSLEDESGHVHLNCPF